MRAAEFVSLGRIPIRTLLILVNSGRPPVHEPGTGNLDRPAAEPNCDPSLQKLPDRVKSASGKILGGRVRTRFEYNELEE